MLILVISIAAVMCAFVCIRAKYTKNKVQLFIFKPLTTSLIIVLAIVSDAGSFGPYKSFIIGALLFCLMGDVFLILPNKFLQGLISFFISQALFSFAFLYLGKTVHWWLILIFSMMACLLYLILSPYLGKMRIPVLLYMIVISFMAWRAWENLSLSKSWGTVLVAAGTILFVISDANLAFNKFRKSYKSAEAIILSTYYLAIWMFSFSLHF